MSGGIEVRVAVCPDGEMMLRLYEGDEVLCSVEHITPEAARGLAKVLKDKATEAEAIIERRRPPDA